MRYFLEISYNGSTFHGWQSQPNAISVQETIENALKTLLKDEIKIEKERVKDIKLFLRQEQALIRKELAEKQRQFLKQLQLEKQIEKFRVREVKELEKLELNFRFTTDLFVKKLMFGLLILVVIQKDTIQKFWKNLNQTLLIYSYVAILIY